MLLNCTVAQQWAHIEGVMISCYIMCVRVHFQEHSSVSMEILYLWKFYMSVYITSVHVYKCMCVQTLHTVATPWQLHGNTMVWLSPLDFLVQVQWS